MSHDLELYFMIYHLSRYTNETRCSINQHLVLHAVVRGMDYPRNSSTKRQLLYLRSGNAWTRLIAAVFAQLLELMLVYSLKVIVGRVARVHYDCFT